MGSYTALFLDLDNTILDFTASEHRAIRQILQQYALPTDDETVCLYSSVNRQFWEAHERGEIRREEIFEGRFRRLMTLLGTERDTAKMSEDYFYALSDGHDLIDGARDLLTWLKEKGYLLYATTNGIAKTQYKRVEDAGIKPFFDAIFVSETVGAQKPSTDYFDYVFAHVPVLREQVLVVGDSLTSDIAGGKASGLDTCWFNPSGRSAKTAADYEIRRLSELKQILETK